MTKEGVQQRQMETWWLADPVLSKRTQGPSATRVCRILGTPSVPPPGEGVGGRTDATVLMLQSRKPNSPALQDQG